MFYKCLFLQDMLQRGFGVTIYSQLRDLLPRDHLCHLYVCVQIHTAKDILQEWKVEVMMVVVHKQWKNSLNDVMCDLAVSF